MASLSQTGRPARVTTSLGADKLVLERMVAEEGVSTPFKYTLDLLSLDPAIDTRKLLRTPVTVTLEVAGGERHFHGIVSRFAQVGRGVELTTYRAEVVPQLWFLGLARDHRCFLNKSAKQIVETLLGEFGVTEFTWSLAGSPAPRDYCVQYGERTLDFVHRLLEDEGIFYFFSHGESGHKLVLTDQNSTMTPVAGQTTMRFATAGATTDPDVAVSFVRESAVHPGTMTLRDYDFTKPSTRVEGTESGVGDEEVYDYPGGAATRDTAAARARRRLEAVEALEQVARGAGGARQLQPGFRVKLDDHFDAAANIEYFLLDVRHTVYQGGWTTDEPSFSYENAFTAAPFAVPFRPEARTPRPRVAGPQTAVVVGPKGEEIYTDKYGRVKVQFHWDRKGERNESSSAWVRVASSWAGKNWGAVHIPRIGQEVVVAFAEGDPDQPLIIGSVYNAEQMPPYDLPANMTQSGVKSRSTKQGGTADFNEIRFEDKKGGEEIYLHAQKNFRRHVENDETVTVQRHRTVHLSADGEGGKSDDTLKITKGDQTVTLVEGNQTVTLNKGTQSTQIDQGDCLLQVDKGDGTIIYKQGNVAEQLEKGNRTLMMFDGNRTTKLSKGNDETSLTNGNVKVALAKGNHSTELTNGEHAVKVTQGKASTEVTSGDISIEAKSGAVTLTALKELVLKVGASTVTLKPTGIEMKFGANTVALTPAGVAVKGTTAKIEGMAMTEIKAPMTQVNGQGVLKMQGAITMIN